MKILYEPKERLGEGIMNSKELLICAESESVIELTGSMKKHETKSSIPADLLNCEIKKSAPTLEELGYSFEVGM